MFDANKQRNPTSLDTLYRPVLILYAREKGKDLTKSYEKSPYANSIVKRAKWRHKKATKKFDCTAIADRLKTVSSVGTATQLVWLTYCWNQFVFNLLCFQTSNFEYS